MTSRPIGALLLVCISAAAFANERGTASWYGGSFHGRPTACGQIYNEWGLTAAHRTLKCGSVVRVINLANNRHVDVRITDRGPFVAGRIIDLSRGAKNAIGMDGTAKVLIVPLRHRSTE